MIQKSFRFFIPINGDEMKYEIEPNGHVRITDDDSNKNNGYSIVIVICIFIVIVIAIALVFFIRRTQKNNETI